MCGWEGVVVDFTDDSRGYVVLVLVLGIGALDLRAGIFLAGVVAERREVRERIDVGPIGTVPVEGEQGAVLKWPEGVDDVMLASPSRDVSEIKMEGLSADLSDEPDR